MAFRLGRGKRGSEAPLFSEEQVIWGVARRAGLDEQDDPKAHAGLTQHAFEVGNDERAICGFEPPKRASTPTAKPRAQLSVPNTRLNPRCPKCLKLIAVPVEVAPEPADAALEPAAEEHADVAVIAPTDDLAPAEQEPPPQADVAAAVRIGEAEADGGYPTDADADAAVPDMVGEAVPLDEVAPADTPDPSIMAIVAAAAEPEAALAPEPEDPSPPEPEATQAPPEPEATQAPPELEVTPAPAEPIVQPWPLPPVAPAIPPPPPPAKAAVDPPMSMRSASWEGTVIYAAGQMTALVRPPSQPGMGVVASVISGPSGTRVGSVHINADGLAVISLSEPARGPVSVAWFAVPAVDENLRPGRP